MKHGRQKCGTRRVRSLSARRAWIETLAGYEDAKTELVALRKEGVD